MWGVLRSRPHNFPPLSLSQCPSRTSWRRTLREAAPSWRNGDWLWRRRSGRRGSGESGRRQRLRRGGRGRPGSRRTGGGWRRRGGWRWRERWRGSGRRRGWESLRGRRWVGEEGFWPRLDCSLRWPRSLRLLFRRRSWRWSARGGRSGSVGRERSWGGGERGSRRRSPDSGPKRRV